jgi:triosephosphate isomerase
MKTLIAANWKMHGDLSWVEKPAEFRRHFSRRHTSVECLILPPFHLIPKMAEACTGLDVFVGAQNCHAQDSGAFTGEISAGMLSDAGAAFVIVGHSERRALFGETDSDIAAKTMAVMAAGLKPIVCIGESEAERVEGRALEIITSQMKGSIPEDIDGGSITIAYEPVWAIGTGLTPTLDDIDEMHRHIRDLLSARFGHKTADTIRILYGGSVKPANAKEILAVKDVNGALIGGAGLEMESLAAIADAA